MDSIMNGESFFPRENEPVRPRVPIRHDDRAGELIYERPDNTSRKLLAILE
jgi:hypothetical protein